MNKLAFIMAGALALSAGRGPGATVLYSALDNLDGWSVRTAGAARVAVTDQGGTFPGAELASSGGTVLLSRELPLEAVRGRRVVVSCLVACREVVRGPQVTSSAKVHLAVQTAGGVRHFAARLEGTSDVHEEGFTADVPADAERVVLNVGLESCFGRATFSRLIVRNDLRGVRELDLSAAANAGHEQLGLAAFPSGRVEWQGVPFRVLDGEAIGGSDCLRLKGVAHEDWPIGSAAVPVGTCASRIYILHGALGGRETSESPCAIWTANFVGGDSASFSVFEGREIGAIEGAKDLENWKAAWWGRGPDGREVVFGVTCWTVYNTLPVLSVSCRAYAGAPPVVLAATVVEDAFVVRPSHIVTDDETESEE